MSVQHFRSLLFKSAQIQQEIEKEQNRRLPDWMRLLKLKKWRLAIKDRLQEIARQGETMHRARRMQPVMVTIKNSNNREHISWEGR